MIHEEDEIESSIIDFSWFYFIGTAKLHLSIRETGRLTLTMFNRLYSHYKDNWDMEMILQATHTTYADAYRKQQKSEEWF